MDSDKLFMWWLRKHEEGELQELQRPVLYAPVPEPPFEYCHGSSEEEEEPPRVIIIDI